MAKTSDTSKASATSATTTAATIPNPSPTQQRQGKTNPLSLLMKMIVNLKDAITDEERQLMGSFITGDGRLSDSHLAQLAAFFTKRVHIGYTQLGIKVAGQLALESDGNIPTFRSEIEHQTGVVFAIQDQIDRSYSDTYQAYTLTQMRTANSFLWDSYGTQGTINPGLIDRANARAKADKIARNANA